MTHICHMTSHITCALCLLTLDHAFECHDSFVRHDSSTLVNGSGLTHSNTHATWLIHVCDVSHSSECHDSWLIRVTRLIHVCAMTRSLTASAALCIYSLWIMRSCVMTHPCDMTLSHPFNHAKWVMSHKFAFMTHSQNAKQRTMSSKEHDVWIMSTTHVSHIQISCLTHLNMHATWLIHVCNVSHSSECHDSRVMTHLYVCHDSFRCAPWLIHIVWRDSFMCAMCLILPSVMTHSRVMTLAHLWMNHGPHIWISTRYDHDSFVCHDSFICVHHASLILVWHDCAMTHPCVTIQSYMCVMTRSYLCDTTHSYGVAMTSRLL